ncbi:MAG TPA: hypothetical protein VF846_07700 [Thermoanaerobaculia bacterium]|jgi:hypothetical protein
MRLLLSIVLLLVSTSVFAQELFPTFSVTGATSPSSFDTNVRIDPEETGGEGTLVSFEDDLGLEGERTVQRFGLQWRPFARHELAATYFSAPRSGIEQINRDIVFRDETYPVNALVTTEFDLDYASATYTYWARRSDRDGLGITLGVAALALDASITAERPGQSVTVTQTAETEVPVALAGVQGRFAFTRTIFGEASVSTLPSVTIGDYTGTALTAGARLEYRPFRWIGVGAAYHYFRLDVDVDQGEFGGSLDMTIRGPEAFVRLAF